MASQDKDNRDSFVQMLNNIRDHIMESLYTGDFKYDAAMRTLNQHLEIAHNMEEHMLQARALNAMATIELERNAFDKAEQLYLQAIEVHAVSGTPVGQGILMNNLGEVMRRWGKVEKAAEYYERAVPIFEEHGTADNIILIASNQGMLWTDAGQAERGIRYFQKALELAGSLDSVSKGTQGILSETLNGMARAHLQINDMYVATVFAERALEQALEVALVDKMAAAYQTMAQITIISEASPEVVVNFLQKSEDNWRRFHSPSELGDYLMLKGDYLMQQSDINGAILAYEEAVSCFESINAVPQVEMVQDRLAALRE